ncbi:hypothetical protein [Georgenia sp. SYP-B2076]|uniref:hypothetical protein n=1 Tax=Georgenia sp. SYP-B2076 TaxID=2495881 RepID=UPI0013E04693|nr:hypothetical protein [Georgenia sp. SYP-B2076]
MASIEERVARAAEAALREHGYIAPVDVLIGMGWLQPVHRDHWRRALAVTTATRSGGAPPTASSPTGWPRRSGAC